MHMRKTSTRGFLLKPWTAAVAFALAGPGTVMAEQLFVPLTRDADMTRYDSDYVELGAAYNDSNSYKFGEYTGLYKDGWYGIGNFNARRRMGDVNYLNASGYNLGLDSLQAGIEYGGQGRYWIQAGYEQIERYQYDDTRFIHNGLGSNSLTLSTPCGGFAQPNTGQAIIDPCLQKFDIKQKRKDFLLGGGLFGGTNWKFSVDYRETKQDGDRIQGAVMGNSGGNPRSAILPYDRDSKTHQIEARLEWFTKQAQANVSFWYSKFDPDSNARTWQNPYTNAWGAACNPGAGGCAFPTGLGRVGLMPENDFWQLQGTGAWNINPKNRVTGTLAYSVAKQDESFQPYTINGPAFPGGPTQTPGTNLAVNTALPRASLDGEIENTLLDLSWITKPMAKLSVKLNYHYMKHDNKTPEDWYSYIGGDTTNQTAIPPGTDPNTINDGRIRKNLAPGTTENRFKIDGDYHLARGMSVRGWYQYQKIDYKVASEELRSDTDNNQLGVELKKSMSEQFTGWLRYVYDRRRGSDFSTSRPYNASYTNAFVNNLPAANGANLIDNITTMRQFFMADYDNDAITAFGTFTPMDRLTFGLRGDYYKRDYKGPDCGGPNDQIVQSFGFTFPAECLGKQQMKGQAYTVDASLTPAPGWNTFAFYTYQTFKTNQTGRAFSGGGTELAEATNPNRDWSHTIEQVDNTFGMGLRYQPSNKKWDAGMQYVYTQGKGSYDPFTGTTLAPGGVEPVPDTVSRVNSFQLFGKYHYSKNIIIRFNYWYEKLDSSDWAYDGTTPTSSQNVLLTGQQSPQYQNNFVGVSVAYTGW